MFGADHRNGGVSPHMCRDFFGLGRGVRLVTHGLVDGGAWDVYPQRTE